MKSKYLPFYAVAAISLGFVAFPSLADQFVLGESSPGFTLCLEWIKAGEQFVLSQF